MAYEIRLYNDHRVPLFLLVLCLLCAPFHAAKAANVYCVADYAAIQPQGKSIHRNWPKHGGPKPDICGIIEIEGEINAGDADRFMALLRANHPYVNGVQLNSRGGNVAEALRIGHAVRDNLLTATAPFADRDGAFEVRMPLEGMYRGTLSCSSACFLIWSAGVQRLGGGGPRGADEPRLIGLHRPTSDDPQFTSLSPDQAAKTYLSSLGQIRAYLEEMEIPRNYIEDMTDTSSRDIRFLTWKEAKALEFPPSIIEPLLPVCGPEPEKKDDDAADAYADSEKHWRHCWQKRLNNFRDDLPAAKD